MKLRSREINIFSMSALDLFASALGAFILMSLIFMVFFTITLQDSGVAEEVKTALAQCEAQLADSVDASELAQCRVQLEDSVEVSALARCEAQLNGSSERLDRVNEELEACQSSLKKTFVLIVASWSSRDDVDLHVVDLIGREFYYGNRRQRGTPAALEEDNTTGPGNEVWLHPLADPGRYRVCYKLFGGSPSPAVRGSILWQEGKIEIPNVTLTLTGQVRLAIEVLVDNDGRVSVDLTRTGEVLGAGGCG